MQIVREVREINSDEIIIKIPGKFRERKVEIIVSSVEEPEQDSYLTGKLEAIDQLNGLISDQGKEKLEEFDRIISQRNAFRKNPVQL
jgi:hypothetical protein